MQKAIRSSLRILILLLMTMERLRDVEVPDIEILIGSNHDDVLAGDFRFNVIWGLAGDDKLYGGPDGGDDWLLGGAGNDEGVRRQGE